MIPDAREVRLEPETRAVLEARVRAPTMPQLDVLRAKIVLMAAAGLATRLIARELGVMPRTVSVWRNRFADEGLDGLQERPRPGGRASAAKYDATTDRRILDKLAEPPPAGMARWTGGLSRRPWAMSATSMSGAFYAPRRSISTQPSPGA
jgi:hypothetical protein